MRFNVKKILNSFSGASIVVSCLFLSNMAQATPVVLGDPLAGGGVDGWQAIMVINENDAYTNTSGSGEQVTVDSFNFTVGAARGQVTPFVVRINNGVTNDFTIVAIGDTRYFGSDYNGTGDFFFDFSTVLSSFIIEAGDIITSGFLDATASGQSNGSVIPYRSGDSLFLTGGSSNSGSGNLSAGIGFAPTFGTSTFVNGLSRDYSYNIGITVAAVPEPAPLALLGLGLLGMGIARKRRR